MYRAQKRLVGFLDREPRVIVARQKSHDECGLILEELFQETAGGHLCDVEATGLRLVEYESGGKGSIRSEEEFRFAYTGSQQSRIEDDAEESPRRKRSLVRFVDS